MKVEKKVTATITLDKEGIEDLITALDQFHKDYSPTSYFQEEFMQRIYNLSMDLKS